MTIPVPCPQLSFAHRVFVQRGASVDDSADESRWSELQVQLHRRSSSGAPLSAKKGLTCSCYARSSA